MISSHQSFRPPFRSLHPWTFSLLLSQRSSLLSPFHSGLFPGTVIVPRLVVSGSLHHRTTWLPSFIILSSSWPLSFVLVKCVQNKFLFTPSLISLYIPVPSSLLSYKYVATPTRISFPFSVTFTLTPSEDLGHDLCTLSYLRSGTHTSTGSTPRLHPVDVTVLFFSLCTRVYVRSPHRPPSKVHHAGKRVTPSFVPVLGSRSLPSSVTSWLPPLPYFVSTPSRPLSYWYLYVYVRFVVTPDKLQSLILRFHSVRYSVSILTPPPSDSSLPSVQSPPLQFLQSSVPTPSSLSMHIISPRRLSPPLSPGIQELLTPLYWTPFGPIHDI